MKQSKGFTLIEVMVVFAIMTILFVIAAGAISKNIKKQSASPPKITNTNNDPWGWNDTSPQQEEDCMVINQKKYCAVQEGAK